jgi:hypothetical protein
MLKIPGSIRTQVLNFWFGPKATVYLDGFRVCLGAALLLYMRERWLYATEWLTQEGFHVSAANLPYHPFTVPLLSVGVLSIFGLLLFGSIAALILGWLLPWSIWIAWGCVVYVTLADQLAAFTLNKLSIVSLLVLALSTPAARRRSNDGFPVGYQAAWPVRILQMTLLIHYFTAGWSKAVFGDWLSNPLALWTQVQGVYRTDFAAWLLERLPLNAWVVMQWAALLFELSAPVIFSLKSTRRFALLGGCVFQLMLALTMEQLIYFMLVMFSFYVFFLKEETLYRGHDIFRQLLKSFLKICHLPTKG